MLAAKLNFILGIFIILVFVAFTVGVTINDGSSKCSLEQTSNDCPPEMKTIIYEDLDTSKMCCVEGTKAEKTQKAKANSCRPTKCVATEDGYHGISFDQKFCSSPKHLTPRIVNGRELEYDGFMEDRCTSSDERRDGVVALCCPPGSNDAYLVTTFGAESNEFPHMAKLSSPGQICGATVYNKRFVITAAHCVVDSFDGDIKALEGMTVTLAVSNIADVENDERFLYKVKRAIPHEGYSKMRGNPEREKGYMREFNDIALLELDRTIEFDDNVKALEIAPNRFQPLAHANRVLVLGWGRQPKNFQWVRLQKSNFLVRNDSACFDPIDGYYWTMDSKKDQFLCLGGILDRNWSPIVGRGDAGGPAVCRGEDGNPVLCGVTSMGPPHQKCLDEQNSKSCPPSVFTDVGYFHDWIKRNAGGQELWTLYKPYLYGRQIANVLYEHQVHITSDTGSSCGGTLLAQDIVLTTAQCIFQGDEFGIAEIHSGILVRTGNRKRLEVEEAEHLKGFKRLWPKGNIDLTHDLFANSDHHKLALDYYHKNDLALIKLTEKVNIDPSRIPRLPKESEFYSTGKEVAYTRNVTGAKRGEQLMERDFKILGPEDCQKRLKRLGTAGMKVEFDEGLLCGVEVYSGGSTCDDRELGGALIHTTRRGAHVLTGVQVFRLCERSYPNLFADIGFETNSKWITNTIRKWSR